MHSPIAGRNDDRGHRRTEVMPGAALPPAQEQARQSRPARVDDEGILLGLWFAALGADGRGYVLVAGLSTFHDAEWLTLCEGLGSPHKAAAYKH
jgi:hypothetical protein